MKACLGSEGIAPRILDLGTSWRWVVSFTPDRFTLKKRAPGTHWIGGWVGGCEEKNSQPLSELEPRTILLSYLSFFRCVGKGTKR